MDIEDGKIFKIKKITEMNFGIFIPLGNIICVVKKEIVLLDFNLEIQWKTTLHIEEHSILKKDYSHLSLGKNNLV